MKLNELKPQPGSKKKRMIVGRGEGSGKGKTCGSGQKGQKSRSGVAIKGFEGGQMPIHMRMPKMGFSNEAFTKKYAELTLGKLQDAIDSKKVDVKKDIDEAVLVAAKVINRKKDGVKLLGGGGKLTSKVNLKIAKATKSAQEAVAEAGGKIDFIVVERAPIVNKKKKS